MASSIQTMSMGKCVKQSEFLYKLEAERMSHGRGPWSVPGGVGGLATEVPCPGRLILGEAKGTHIC